MFEPCILVLPANWVVVLNCKYKASNFTARAKVKRYTLAFKIACPAVKVTAVVLLTPFVSPEKLLAVVVNPDVMVTPPAGLAPVFHSEAK